MTLNRLFWLGLLVIYYSTLPKPVICQKAELPCNRILMGEVLNQKDSLPLQFANILISENGRGTISDPLGRFSMEQICGDTITVTITHLGCSPYVQRIILSSAKVFRFYLDHKEYDLQEIQISSGSFPVDAYMDPMKLSFRGIQGQTGNDLGQVLNALPGVRVLSTGTTINKPVIQGFHSNRVVVLNNGIRQEGQQWGFEHAPEIDPTVAEEISALQGPAAIEAAPEGLAGVISVSPEKLPEKPGARGEFSGGYFSNNHQANISGKFQGMFRKIPLKWRVQGSFRKGGEVKTPDNRLENTGFGEANFSYSLGYNIKNAKFEFFYSQFNQELGIYKNSHFGNLSDLISAISQPQNSDYTSFSYSIHAPKQLIEHELVKGKFSRKTGRSDLKIILARQFNRRAEYDSHNNQTEDASAKYKLTTYSGEVKYGHLFLNDKLKTSIGIQHQNKANTFFGRDFMPNYRQYNTGLILTSGYTLDLWKIDATVRTDNLQYEIFRRNNEKPEHSYFGNAFSIGLERQIREFFKVSFSATSTWRPPAINELYSDGIHHGTAAIELGNDQLEVEKLKGLNIKLEKTGAVFSGFVMGYFNYIHQFIYLKPNGFDLTIRGAFPVFAFYQANASFRGADMGLTYQPDENWRLESILSLLQATNESDGSYFPMIPSQRANIKLIRNLPRSKTFYNNLISISMEAVAKQERAPESLVKYFEDGNFFSTEIPENFEFSPPPAGFLLWSLSAETSIKLGGTACHLSVEVTNLFNTSYREYMNRLRYFSEEPGRNIMLRFRVPFQIFTHEKE